MWEARREQLHDDADAAGADPLSKRAAQHQPADDTDDRRFFDERIAAAIARRGGECPRGHNYGDLMDAVLAIDNPKDAQRFKRGYVAFVRDAPDRAPNDPPEDIVASNLGYMTGYFGRAEARRVRELFAVEHPIFGASEPTAEEAYAEGLALGEQSRRRAAKK